MWERLREVLQGIECWLALSDLIEKDEVVLDVDSCVEPELDVGNDTLRVKAIFEEFRQVRLLAEIKCVNLPELVGSENFSDQYGLADLPSPIEQQRLAARQPLPSQEVVDAQSL